MYALTYTDDVVKLTQDGLVVADSGVYPKLIKRVSTDDDNDGMLDHIILLMTKIDTAYGEPINGKIPSLSLIKLQPKDIFRNTESEFYDAEYVPFCEAVGLTVLAYGRDTYQQVQDDKAMLALYETVLPPVEILDENGDGTGELKFNQWIEIDAPIRS